MTNEKREVLWNAVEIFSFHIAMNFAICNREKGKDFAGLFLIKKKKYVHYLEMILRKER